MRIISSIFLSLVIAANVFAADLDITDAWARTTGGVGKNTAVYMKIYNKGKDDNLTSVKTDVTNEAELHKTATVSEINQMVKMDKVMIPAGSTVNFEPGGMHVMLMKVSKDLKSGDQFDLKLQFEKEGERTVNVQVK